MKRCYYINKTESLFQSSNMLCLGSFIDHCMTIYTAPLGNIKENSTWKSDIFVLKQWFSTRADFSLQGTFCPVWKYFQLSQLGRCYCHLREGSQGCWWTSISAENSLSIIIQSKRLKNPCLKESKMKLLPTFSVRKVAIWNMKTLVFSPKPCCLCAQMST